MEEQGEDIEKAGIFEQMVDCEARYMRQVGTARLRIKVLSAPQLLQGPWTGQLHHSLHTYLFPEETLLELNWIDSSSPSPNSSIQH